VRGFLHHQHVYELQWIHWQEAKFLKIPFNFGHCPNLRVFDLSKCINLKILPTSINKLIALQELDLLGCMQLKELPTSIDKLIAFQSLNLSECS
jgi:Leucine-rich repeat (LRR) protein